MAAKQPAMSPSDLPVEPVLDRATGPRRSEVDQLMALHEAVSGQPPVVWAGRIIGFGTYDYRYDSGHGGTAPLLAFAPGPTRHTIYLAADYAQKWPELLGQLGPHQEGRSCLYISRLSKVDQGVLRQLLELSLAEVEG